MTVGSALELYTTVFGWGQYNNLWVLLTTTGLVYLPFLGMVLRNVIEPYQAMEVERAAGASVRRLEVDIAIALSVVVLAGQPFVALSPDVLAYKPPCTGATATAGSSGTTYDAVPFASLVHGEPHQGAHLVVCGDGGRLGRDARRGRARAGVRWRGQRRSAGRWRERDAGGRCLAPR